MKKIVYIFTAFLIVSCGSTKKAVETPNENVKEVDIKTNIPVEIKEDIDIPNDYNSKNVVRDETKNLESKNDDLGFYQNLSKREGPLHDLFGELLEKHVSENGNVNYEGFKKSHEQLLGYISILGRMYPELDKLKPSREQKLAYWINAYNALTIDLILRNHPVKSIKDIKDPWDQRLWKFGDKWINLNQIEHDILRKMDEPRIHFAIVCASFSCPKLQNNAFIASNLETQLTKATKAFLADKNRNDISENDIKLSKIFKWFKKDFEQDGSLIDFLNKYSEIEILPNAKKSFMNYNWDLND